MNGVWEKEREILYVVFLWAVSKVNVTSVDRISTSKACSKVAVRIVVKLTCDRPTCAIYSEVHFDSCIRIDGHSRLG